MTHSTAQDDRRSRLLDAMPAIAWSASAQTFRFTYVNPAAEKLLGYPVSRWLEEPHFWAEHLHPEDRHVPDALPQRDGGRTGSRARLSHHRRRRPHRLAARLRQRPQRRRRPGRAVRRHGRHHPRARGRGGGAGEPRKLPAHGRAVAGLHRRARRWDLSSTSTRPSSSSSAQTAKRRSSAGTSFVRRSRIA